MKITSCDLYKYSLPIKNPLVIHGQSMTHREGLIIHLKSANQTEGFGEISPLPGVSQETLEEAQKQFQALKPFLLSEEIPDYLEHLNGRFHKWLGNFQLKSSVQFGIEMAILNLVANTKDVVLNHLISEFNHDDIQINGLLFGSKETVVKQAQELLAQGFIALKLKVGKNITEEIDKVNAINDLIHGRALLHLDANQSWDLNKAIEFGNEVGCAAVDYIEEPFPDIQQITEFFFKTTIPVALDESLQKCSLHEAKSIEGVELVVLKPMILGGIERTWQMMKEARSYALRPVISSSFESSLGITMLAHLVGSISRDYAAGLDTLKWFEKDVFKKPVAIDHGKIHLGSSMTKSDDINFDLLKKL